MEKEARIRKIIEIVRNSGEPVSGTSLAKQLNVSRQVVVQDIALIRAQGVDIVSTNRGYTVSTGVRYERIVKSVHTESQIEDELFAIVDCGGNVENIIVNHRFYNRIEAPLNIRSRRDALKYIEAIKSGKSKSLSSATSGYHYHTISADSEKTLDIIEEEIKARNLWLPLDDWINS